MFETLFHNTKYKTEIWFLLKHTKSNYWTLNCRRSWSINTLDKRTHTRSLSAINLQNNNLIIFYRNWKCNKNATQYNNNVDQNAVIGNVCACIVKCFELFEENE